MRSGAVSGHHAGTRRVTWIWLLLVGLTVVTYAIARAGFGGPAVMAFLMLTVSVKGHWIIDDFMGLRKAPLLWRGLAHGWMLVVVALIAVAYFKGL